MTNKAKIALIAAAVVVTGGFIGLSAVKKRQPTTAARLEKVKKSDITSVVSASGQLEPKKKVDVSSDITGRIVQLPFREGEFVHKGQVVVRIDPTQYEAGVDRAQAGLASAQAGATQAQANKDQAQRAWERARDLRAQNANLVSQQDLETAQTTRDVAAANLDAAQRQVDQARAGLREAQDALGKTTITAPMDGKITRLAVEEGEVAVPGTFSRETGLLMTVSDLSIIQTTVKVDETDVVRIHMGDSAEVAIDAFPDTVFSGRVTKISNSSVTGAATTTQQGQDQAVDYYVEVTLDHPPAGVRPDLSATARIVTDTRRQVLSVPIIALAVRPTSDTSMADTARGNGRRGNARPASGSAQAQTPNRAAPAAAESTGTRQKDVEGVFVVDTVTNLVHFRAVRTGITGDENVEVLSGLRENDMIVAGPYQAVRDMHNGAKVRNQQGGPGMNRPGQAGASK